MKDARFSVKRSAPGMGQGLFAHVDIKKGDFILEYTGTKMPTKDANELKSRYLFEINDEWTIEGSARSNTARYINHSCDPNVEAEIRDGHIMIDAVRAIKKGEELTIDYGGEYYDEFIAPKSCRCPAQTHRAVGQKD